MRSWGNERRGFVSEEGRTRFGRRVVFVSQDGRSTCKILRLVIEKMRYEREMEMGNMEYGMCAMVGKKEKERGERLALRKLLKYPVGRC
jgi:hypothetical protein